MSIKVKRYTNDPLIETNPMIMDSTQTQRETTVDGYTFHWGTNERRNFLDDNIGIRHRNFAVGNATGTTNIVLDTLQTGDARS